MTSAKDFVKVVALVVCIALGALLCVLHLAFDVPRMALLWLPTRLYNKLSARLLNEH